MKAVLFAFAGLLAPEAGLAAKSLRTKDHGIPGLIGSIFAGNEKQTETVVGTAEKKEPDVTQLLLNKRTNSSSTSSCVGNVLPADMAAGPHSALGLAKFQDVLDKDRLTAAVLASNLWTTGEHWDFSFTANSARREETIFAFAGHGSSGFFRAVVPAGAMQQRFTMSGSVFFSNTTNKVSFEYLGPAAVITDKEITLTDLCLRPVLCEAAAASVCSPSDEWRPLADLTKPGSTRQECCERMMCKDNATICQPLTKYAKIPDFNTTYGSTMDRCCTPVICPATLCANQTKWTHRFGDGILGSTQEECCSPVFCDSYTCAETTTRGRRTSGDWATRQGSTDAECCEDKTCATFDCKKSYAFTDPADKASRLGGTFTECCEPLYCEDYTCPPSWQTLSTNLSNGKKRLGNDTAHCCFQTTCENFVCNDTKWHKLPGGAGRVGWSLQECCTPRQCSDWNCSSATKLVKKADIGVDGLAIIGYSDEECCDKVMCFNYDCLPSTMWQAFSNASKLATALGSTHEECCEPVYCQDWNCSGDTDGDGISTIYYKKVDTNHYMFQGSTDAECCIPRRCNQYFTRFPSKWRRKPDVTLLGSTDGECYDPVLCSDRECCPDGKVLRPHANMIQGSTVAECCIQNSTA